jgi:hypothetical protein
VSVRSVHSRTSGNHTILSQAEVPSLRSGWQRVNVRDRRPGARAGDAEYVRQLDREFFIGFEQSWRAKVGEAAMRTQLASESGRR